jgi:MFS family permease
VLNEILAKLNQNEKLIGVGSIGVALGWILGQILGNRSECVYGYCVSANYFSWGSAGLFAILALLIAIAAVVVLYLKLSEAKITWPMPVAQILLGITVAALACAALAVLMQVTNGLSGAPVLVYLADAVLVGAAAVAAYGAYMQWTASKAA